MSIKYKSLYVICYSNNTFSVYDQQCVENFIGKGSQFFINLLLFHLLFVSFLILIINDDKPI